MLKYLVIQIDDTSVSFCHYGNERTEPNLLPVETLKKVLFWSMRENLTVQIVYPDFELPMEYKEAISVIDHADIVSSECKDLVLLRNADVVIFNSWESIHGFSFKTDQAYVIRTSTEELLSNANSVNDILPKLSRLNIVLTDVEKFNDDIAKVYGDFLDNLAVAVSEEYKKGHAVQLNLLTDRMMLKSMNNCGAGDESITLAPDGKFYICPGFYADGSLSAGDIGTGLDIKNKQLYQLNHAPICRICDAWQCKRCVLHNKKLTLEVNTPGREQCVMSHIERNAARKLMERLRENGIIISDNIIPEIDYLDPFDKLTNKQ